MIAHQQRFPGQHSSHPRSCPNYLGIFLGPRYSFSVGTGPLALTPPELDTSYLMYGVVFPLYYTTIGQAVASVSPTAEIAAILFSLLFTFVVVFNGVLQPFRVLGWWQWMHRLSPFSYLIEGILGQAIGRQQVNCSPIEFVNITPPSGQSCGQYMTPFISRVGGYLTNPNATSSCQFCTVRTTDELIGTNFDIFYNHRWRNLGFMMVYITFNVFCIFALTYLFRIRTGSLLPSFRRIKKTNARYATEFSRTSSTHTDTKHITR
ncbi:hypothetical protein L208DRAFT_1469180 [Tricholoma matsutake]|nr:hypothetical protein L208DRAFT_1469180 [Tricholoma matsutake 945]